MGGMGQLMHAGHLSRTSYAWGTSYGSRPLTLFIKAHMDGHALMQSVGGRLNVTERVDLFY
jgi:hypothetical protein